MKNWTCEDLLPSLCGRRTAEGRCLVRRGVSEDDRCACSSDVRTVSSKVSRSRWRLLESGHLIPRTKNRPLTYEREWLRHGMTIDVGQNGLENTIDGGDQTSAERRTITQVTIGRRWKRFIWAITSSLLYEL